MKLFNLFCPKCDFKTEEIEVNGKWVNSIDQFAIESVMICHLENEHAVEEKDVDECMVQAFKIGKKKMRCVGVEDTAEVKKDEK